LKDIKNEIKNGEVLNLGITPSPSGDFSRRASHSAPAVFNLKTNLNEYFSNFNNEI
jgi:hypothetical protein